MTDKMTLRVAVLDDYQQVAAQLGDWSQISPAVALDSIAEHIDRLDDLAVRLRHAQVVVAMRERTPLTAELFDRIPGLRLIVTTGPSNAAIDVAAANERSIEVRGTGGYLSPTSELTWALILALVRHIPAEDRSIRAGGWQHTMGTELAGKVLGIVGLGRLGTAVARVGRAFDMRVIAWSENLDPGHAAAHGVEAVSKAELFSKNHATGKWEPFHLYSMRQAIEERFIHDVLANYTTYKTYWNIEKAVQDDPAYDPGKAKAAIAKYVSLHEHNLSQKADIIINHFRTHVAPRVGGKAKAMVVTASRLHAVRYGLALRKHCADHGIGDVGVLVAFSGSLRDPDHPDKDLTESSINEFPESQTPKRFDTDEYQILVVAEKYQTGFDQPKLHTMYVDKPLSGLAAVQTLSRLNRRHPDKDSTFVLDFRNEADHIRDAFAPWYVQTVTPPSDPNLMFDAHHELSHYDVLWHEETEAFVRVLLADPHDTARIHGMLEGAKARFWNDLDEEEQDGFRDALKKFVTTYSYLSQIVPSSDIKLERDYLFCKALAPFIRRPDADAFSLEGEVDLTHLATRVTFEGEIDLDDADNAEVNAAGELGSRPGVPDGELLSEIISTLNERFGTDFSPEDRVFFDSLVDKLADRPDVQQAAAANSSENFRLIMADQFQGGVIDQLDTSQAVAKNYLDNNDFATTVMNAYMPLLETKAKVAHQQHCPIGELIARGEDAWLEYKATLRTHAEDRDEAKAGDLFKPLESMCIKTIAAFLNSYDGGTLLIGVADDGTAHGLESDYATLRSEDKDNSDADLFQLHLTQLMVQCLGTAAATLATTEILTVEGKDICRVHVRAAGFPVDAQVTSVDAKGQHTKKKSFFVRVNNGTRPLTDDDKQRYIAQRWGSV